MATSRVKRVSTICAVLALGWLAGPVPPRAAEPCTAQVSGTVVDKNEGEQSTEWKLKVDVACEQACADVTWQLVVQEQDADGEQRTVRQPEVTSKVRDGEAGSEETIYSVAKGVEVTDWSFPVLRCTVCDLEP